MIKKIKSIVVILLSFCLIGCSKDKITLEKDYYLVLKEKLLEQKKFTKDDDISFDLTINIDKINEEEISYKATIDNPEENMHNIKAIVVHDHLTDEIFPSVGIFEEPLDLIVEDESIEEINLVGYIQTTKTVEDLDLEVKTYIEYTNDEDELKKIYYKSTN